MSQDLYRSYAKDNLTVVGGHILVYLKGLILLPLVVKSVDLSVYGGFVLLSSIMSVAFGLSSFGAGFRARRFMPSAGSMSERGNLFYPQFYFNIGVIIALSFAFVVLEKPLIAVFFKHEVTFSIWTVPVYLLTYLLYSQASDYLRYTSRVKYMIISNVAFPYIHILFIAASIVFRGPITIDMLMLSSALSALITATPVFFIVSREIGLRSRFYKLDALVSDIRLGFPLILGFVLDFVLAGSDRYFIASYLSVRDVGYYVPGYVLGSLIIFVPKALGTSLPQLLYKAVDTNGEVQARAMVNYAIKIFLLLAIPFLFGCLALSRPILTILASREVADKAQWVAPIVCMGTIFYGLNLVLSNVLLVRLKTSALFKMNLFAACFSLLANLIALNFLKTILVAAVTTVLSFLIAFVYTYRIVVREWQLEFDIPSVAKSLGASVIMAGVLLIATRSVEYGNDFVLVGCSIVIGTVTYVGCLFALRMFSEREIYFMKGLLGQLKSAVFFW